MNALVIYNPAAGQGRSGNVPAAIRSAYGAHIREMAVTQGSGDACQAAQRAALRPDLFDAVLIAGGDGTVNEAVNGLLLHAADGKSPLPIGLIPIGTRNVLARDMGIPRNDLLAQAALVQRGRTRLLDLGRAGDHYFTLVAGFGFDAAVINEVLLPMKEIIGPAAYAFATVGALAKYRSTHFRLILDGQCIDTEAFLVLAANVASYAFGHIRPTPFASPDDGWLDICVFERAKTAKMGFIGQVAAVFARRHLRDPRVRYYRAKRMEVVSDPPVQAQLDGDTFGHTPITVEVIPKALSIFVP